MALVTIDDRCFHRHQHRRSMLSLLMSIGFLMIASIVLLLHVIMHQLTSTSLVGLPNYIQALQMMVCAFVAMLFARYTVLMYGNSVAMRLASAVYALSLCLCVIALVLLFWLAERHDSLVFCVYNPERHTCACRTDNHTLTATGWHLFESIDSCRSLDAIFRLMIAMMIVNASGALLCTFSLMLIYSNGGVPSTMHHHQQRVMTVMMNNNAASIGRIFPPSYDSIEHHRSIPVAVAPVVEHEPPPPYTHVGGKPADDDDDDDDERRSNRPDVEQQ